MDSFVDRAKAVPSATWVAALFVALLAATLRLWAIELAPFGYDEVDVLGRVREVVGGELTATGPLTSWGIPDPPMSVYLMVPPALTDSPAAAAAAWAAVLNALAVMVTFFVTRRFFGLAVATAAGLLYASNPWAVYFSRRTWAEIVPLFTAVALWAVLEVVVRRRAFWAVAFFVALALQVQTRILAVVYAPAALLSLVLFPRRWGLRWPALGIVVGALISLPYAIWVLIHWSDISARLGEGNRGVALAGSGSLPTLVLWTAAGFGLLPAESKAAPWLDPLGQLSRALVALAALLLAFGAGLSIWAALKRRAGWEAGLVVAIWAILPAATLTAQTSSVYLHYLVALFPSAFMLMAMPIGLLLGGGRLAGSIVGCALLVAMCVPQLVTTATVYRLLSVYQPGGLASTAPELRQAVASIPREASEQLGTGERYGVEIPLAYWSALAARARAEAARAGVVDVAVIAGATDPLTAERPAILDYLLRPDFAPRFLPLDTLIFPARQPSLVVEAPDVDPAENIERFGERLAAFPIPTAARGGRDDARLTLIPARSADDWGGLAGTRRPTPLAGGVELLAFRTARNVRPGDDLVVVTYWRLLPDSALHPPDVRLRVVDDAGRPIAESQPSTAGPPPTLAGDRVMVKRQSIPVRTRVTGDYRVEVLVYNANGTLLRRADGAGDGVILAAVRVGTR